ncbi:transglutaminase family protein [Undibacterium arcticum]
MSAARVFATRWSRPRSASTQSTNSCSRPAPAFCEHYASSFVVLMRALGIPARVVTGYQGGEMNPIDGYMTIRQSDAHAWAEVWLPQRGWLRVDPTAAVAPERVELNLRGAIPRHTLATLLGLHAGQDSWGAGLGLNWDAMTNSLEPMGT